MKPRNVNITETVIRNRSEAIIRKDLENDIRDDRSGVIHAASQAVGEINSLSKNNRPDVDGTVVTNVIVLEHRTHNGVGPYAVVAQITTKESARAKDSDEWVLAETEVKIGIGFKEKPATNIPDEKTLGEGLDGTMWYGDWPEEYTESTSGTAELAEKIRNEGKDSAIYEEEVVEARAKLTSMQESIRIALEAAKNPELNTPGKEPIPY